MKSDGKAVKLAAQKAFTPADFREYGEGETNKEIYEMLLRAHCRHVHSDYEQSYGDTSHLYDHSDVRENYNMKIDLRRYAGRARA